MDEATDILMDFLECAVHTILYARQIYPSHIFEQRMKYGITIWQCKHPDICSYVRKVLTTCRGLLEQGILDRLIFTTTSRSLNNNNTGSRDKNSNDKSYAAGNGAPTSSSMKQNKIIDQISINTRINRSRRNTVDADDNYSLQNLEEELRSTILLLTLLDVNMKKIPEDISWTLMMTTGEHPRQSQVDVLQSTLLSGDWIVENSLLPESVAASRVTKNIEKRGIFPFPKSDLMESDVSQEVSQSSCSQNDTRILPVKSFDNEYFSLNVFAHTF